MRAINFVKRLIHDGHLSEKNYTNIHMHMVAPPEAMKCMTASSKTNANWQFFEALHATGRLQMNDWLRKHKKALGKRSTVNIEESFLAKPKRTTLKPTTTKKAN